MNLAKDLAWQKIFRGRSTNLKIEKSGFFLHFHYSHPLFYLISRYPVNVENYNRKYEY